MADSARIDLSNCKSKGFDLYEDLNTNNKNKYKNTANQQGTNLSNLYFSQTNIDYLQDEIVRQIYKKTNGKHKICKQSEDELVIVMKSIYLQFSKHVQNNIQFQIDELNKKVLNYCVDNVYSNLLQHLQYIIDITKEQQVMDRPQSVDIKGEKTLMPNHFI
jgi:hypothetical protein